MKPAPTGKLPSAVRIDNLASNYLNLKGVAEIAKENVALVGSQIIILVQKFGSMPRGATTSLHLTGHEYNLNVAFPQHVDVDGEQVVKLKAALQEAGCPGLLKQLFSTETKYIVAAGAHEAIGALTGKLGRRARSLFSKALHVSPQTPRVTVTQLKKKIAAA